MAVNVVNNRLIAKNTILLYVRMIFVMAVSLYTSRVVLSALGVVDFGIYNVVGGVVSMLSFLNTSMSIAAQRFFSFEIGKKNMDRLNKIFNVCIVVHFFIALFVLLISEVIAPWFLETHMIIPIERMDAAHWVLHLSIATFFVSIIQVPYNAIIMAKERMGIYAYISIIEVVLKLVIVYFLIISSYDKLKTYAFLQFLTSLVIFCINWYYCISKFVEVGIKLLWDKKLFRDILSYASWSMFGEIAWIVSGQGVNIVLNLFCGPVLNAANAVAGQVGSAVNHFVSSFQTAMNPQIIKTYAASEFDETKKLVYRGSKISYFLLLLFSLPLILEVNFVLKLWLKKVPDYTAVFTRLSLVVTLFAIVSNYLAQIVRANGNIRKYQIWVAFIISLSFPLSYIILYFEFAPYHIITTSVFLQFVLIFVRIYLVKDLISITLYEFSKEVLGPIFVGSIIAIVLPIYLFLTLEEGFLRFCVILFVSAISVTLSAFYLGLHRSERKILIDYLNKYKNGMFLKK